MPCSRTQHGLTRVGLEPPTSGAGVQGINKLCLDFDDISDLNLGIAGQWQNYREKYFVLISLK